jgi:hypothetical protein
MHDEGYIFEQWSGKDFPPDDTNQNLSNRDKRDIAKTLEAALKQLDSQDGLMFNNEPLTDTDRALLKQALEIGLKNVIEKNKLKYTPKKYRKDRTK